MAYKSVMSPSAKASLQKQRLKKALKIKEPSLASIGEDGKPNPNGRPRKLKPYCTQLGELRQWMISATTPQQAARAVRKCYRLGMKGDQKYMKMYLEYGTPGKHESADLIMQVEELRKVIAAWVEKERE